MIPKKEGLLLVLRKFPYGGVTVVLMSPFVCFMLIISIQKKREYFLKMLWRGSDFSVSQAPGGGGIEAW